MEAIQKFVERFMGPIATRLNESKYIKALTAGMMSSVAVTLGVAAICIVINLPIPGFDTFIQDSGLYMWGNEVMQATLSSMGIYMVIAISYYYAKNEGEEGIIAALLTLGCYLMLIPQYIVGENYFFAAIESKYLGSDGIFVGMVLALVISSLYCKLMKKNIKLKLPNTVPPMVTNSLSPIFTAMILFTICGALKYICSLTEFGNIYSMINHFVTMPVMSLGANPWSYIFLYTFASLMWFFGVHPSPIVSVFTPIIATVNTANVEAFTRGDPLPYLGCAVIYFCVYFAGQSNTIGLSLSMLKAKSERYKAMRGICLIPNVFNIVEPVVFGIPCVLNPIFLLPMLLSTLLPGILGMLVMNVHAFAINPTIQMPWITPALITSFLQGGIPFALLVVACTILSIFIYYPFFKIVDNQAYKEEQNMLLEKQTT